MPTFAPHQADLYLAERAAGTGRTFANLREARRYVDDLLAQEWVTDTFQVPPTEVVRSRATRTAGYAFTGPAGSTIALAILDQVTALHEVAHVLTDVTTFQDCGHTAPFVRTFLLLVRREMGFHAYGAFLAALRATESFRAADLELVEV